MKTWVHNHPNVPLVFYWLAGVMFIVFAVLEFRDGSYWLAAWDLIIAFSLFWRADVWWDRT